MQQGAYHYVTKPFNLDEVTLLVGKALETTRLRRELRAIRASQREPYSLDRIIGDSPAVAQVKKLLGKIASSPASTVLLTGESGTGKDLAAKVIHYASARAARPFMNITCSALTESLLAPPEQRIRPTESRCRLHGNAKLEAIERGRWSCWSSERTGWNQTRAARLLGLDRDQIGYRNGQARRLRNRSVYRARFPLSHREAVGCSDAARGIVAESSACK